jgi:outer membrane protein
MTSMARLTSYIPVRSLLVLLAVLCVVPVTARADAGVKIGYFDVKRLMQEVDEAREKRETLQGDFKTKQKQLDEMRATIETKSKEFEAKKAVLAPSAREQMQNDVQQLMMKWQQTGMDMQQELAGKEQQAIGELLQKLEPVVQEIANKEGYTYVFEKSETGLFFAPQQHDLTAQLIRKYNERFPAKKSGKK